MAELTESFPSLFNGGNTQAEGDASQEQNENGMGSSSPMAKYGLLNYVFAVISKAQLSYTQVFDLPVLDFLVITNYVVDENKEREKEFKRQQNLFKSRRR